MHLSNKTPKRPFMVNAVASVGVDDSVGPVQFSAPLLSFRALVANWVNTGRTLLPEPGIIQRSTSNFQSEGVWLSVGKILMFDVFAGDGLVRCFSKKKPAMDQG